RRHWVVHVFPIVLGADVVGVGKISEDVTLERETEAERERFVGILGHDLRAPVQGILIASDVLRRGVSSADPELLLSQIRQAARRMGRLIEDILDYVRARKPGGIPLRPSTVDLRAVVAEVVEEKRLAFPAASIAV